MKTRCGVPRSPHADAPVMAPSCWWNLQATSIHGDAHECIMTHFGEQPVDSNVVHALPVQPLEFVYWSLLRGIGVISVTSGRGV